MSATVTIKVPATSANLGPGFDCAGLSLNLFNEVKFTPQVENFTIHVQGEGADSIPTDGTNLIVHAMKTLCRALDRPLPCVQIEQINHVPASSGLGSSSTAVIAGLMGANELLGKPLNKLELLTLATRIEGHPDNVGPALYGGLVVTALNGHGDCFVEEIALPPLRVVIALPHFDLSTKEARAALPPTISREDAIYNLSRLPIVIRALEQGDYAKLGAVMDDKLHQPFRIPLIPGMRDAFLAAKEAGAAAVAMSGAGPSTIAFAPYGHDDIGRAMIAAYQRAGLTARTWQLQVDQQGSQVIYTKRVK